MEGKGVGTMAHAAVTSVGSLGSRFHTAAFPPGFAGRIAELDWSGFGKRIFIDAVNGLVSWMSPSGLHEMTASSAETAAILAARLYGLRITQSLRATRWQGKDAAIEADGAFYTGRNAERYITACREGNEQDFIAFTSPDLVIEVEVFHADRKKPQRWADLGVTEMWRLEKGGNLKTETEILDLRTSVRSVKRSVLFPALSEKAVSYAVHLAYRHETEDVERYLEKVIEKSVPETGIQDTEEDVTLTDP